MVCNILGVEAGDAIDASEIDSPVFILKKGAVGKFISLQSVSGIIVREMFFCCIVVAYSHVSTNPQMVVLILANSANNVVR